MLSYFFPFWLNGLGYCFRPNPKRYPFRSEAEHVHSSQNSWLVHKNSGKCLGSCIPFFLNKIKLVNREKPFSLFQVLRKEHVILSEEVKGLIAGSFPGIDISAAIENLGIAYFILLSKIFDFRYMRFCWGLMQRRSPWYAFFLSIDLIEFQAPSTKCWGKNTLKRVLKGNACTTKSSSLKEISGCSADVGL